MNNGDQWTSFLRPLRLKIYDSQLIWAKILCCFATKYQMGCAVTILTGASSSRHFHTICKCHHPPLHFFLEFCLFLCEMHLLNFFRKKNCKEGSRLDDGISSDPELIWMADSKIQMVSNISKHHERNHFQNYMIIWKKSFQLALKSPLTCRSSEKFKLWFFCTFCCFGHCP